MLTNTGKNILAKYLIGQTQSYASHIAFGCGPQPLSATDTFGDYSNQTSLGFEMFRSPIISRGYVTEYVLDTDGEISIDPNTGEPVQFSQIVLTAQMPTAERYEITEVGIFPAASNPSAGRADSRMMYSFSNTESWQQYTDQGAILSISSKQESLDKINGVIPNGATAGSINVTEKVFFANSDNPVLDSNLKLSRNERPRFLNSSLFIRGDFSATTLTGQVLSPDASAAHVRLSNAGNLNLNRNSAQDQIKLAFALVNKDENLTNPNEVRVIIEFATSDAEGAPYARLAVRLTEGFNANRYFVVSEALEDLEKSTDFAWGNVTTIKAYAEVLVADTPSSDYYIAIDGLRVENVTTQNPLYGLTGYTVLKTEDGRPLIKADRANNLMEFRFAMDVR